MLVASTNMSKKYVVDASFLLAHLIPDEKREDVEEIFDKYVEGEIVFVSSPLLEFEVTNAIWMARKRKRIESLLAKKLVKLFKEYDIEIVQADLKKTINISIKHNLTVYDAGYVVVSRTLGCELLTLDKKLSKI